MKDGNKTSLRKYLHAGGSKQLQDYAIASNPIVVRQNEHESFSSGYDPDWIDTELERQTNLKSDASSSSILDLFTRESTPGGVLDSYNLMQEKRLQGDLNAAKNDLTLLNWKKKEIELAEQYLEDQQLLEKLKQEISLLDKNTNPSVYQLYEDKISEIQDRINNTEEWIKTEGKHSDILRSLFFDSTKSGDTNAQIDSWLYSTYFDRESVKKLKNALQDIWSIKDNYAEAFRALTQSKNPLLAAFNIGIAGKLGSDKMTQALVSGGEAVVENMAATAANLFNLGRRVIRGDEFNKEHNERIDNAIKESDTNDRTYDLFFTNASEIKNNNNLLNRFNSNLEYWKSDVDEKLENKTKDAQDISRKLLNGTWYFKPELIDPKFREALAHTDVGLLGTIIHPLYSFPELGSSFSDFEDFATLTAMDAGVSAITSETALKWLSKKASTVAIGGYLGKLLKIASTLGTVNDIRKVLTASSALEMIPNVILTNRMRLNETKQEVFDAYSNRVLNQLFAEGIDPRIIAKAADKKWMELQEELPEQERVAPPTSLEEKIGLALSLGVDINDKRWDDIQTEARRGLTKVYNENMALAAKDYAEGLVFMPYAGKVLKNALFRELETPLAYRTAEFQQSLGTTRSLKPLVESGKATALQKAEYHAHRIAEKKLASLLGPTAAVSAARVGKFVKNKVGQIMKVAPLEGIEEGQQHLLLTRYQEGKYDDYQKAETSFMDLSSLLNDQELAVQALASYAGMNYGDPTNGDAELRRAMNIGFTTAIWFLSPQVATNLLPTRLTHADNLRNLIASVKTDMSLKRLVGENYARIQDDDHIGKFFDIYKKYGITGERVADTLNEMKKYKGDLVTDLYIDEDVELARETYNQYHSEYLDDVRSDRNIAKNSQEHKFLVQNAVREIRDFKRAIDLATKNENDLSEKQDLILQGVLSELKNVAYERNGDYSHIGGKYKKFIQRALLDYDRIRDDYDTARETWEDNESLLEEAVERLKKRQHLSDAEARTNALEEVRKWVFDDYSDAERKAGARGMQYMSVEDFVEDRLNTIIEYSKLPIYKKLIDDLSKREQLQKLIQEETGTDINTENLASVIDVIKNRREEIRQHALKNVDRINSQRDYFNEVLLPRINQLRKAIGKKERSLQKHTNIQGLINQYGDLAFTDDLTRLIMLEALNTAVAQQLQPRAVAYEFGAVDPYAISLSIRPKKFSELSESRKQEYAKAKLEEAQAKGQKEPTRLQIGQMYNKEQQERMKKFNDLKKRYKKVKSQSFLQGSLDNAINAVENAESDVNEADMLALQKEAASLFIEQQLDEKIENYQERMRIYHTYQKEISEETPVTEQPIEEQPVLAEEKSPTETEEFHPDLDPLTGLEMSDEMRQALNLDSQGDTAQEAAVANILGEQAALDMTPATPLEEAAQIEEAPEYPVEQSVEPLPEPEEVQLEIPEEAEIPLQEPESEPIEDTSEDIAGERNEDLNNEDATDVREGDEEEPVYEDGTTVDEEPIGNIADDEEPIIVEEKTPFEEEPIMVEEKTPFEDDSDMIEGTSSEEDDYDNIPKRGRERRSKRNVSDKDEARAQYLSSLFQYQPNSTKPMYLGVSNDEQKTTPLKLTYELQSGKALAEKLLDKKWILSCDVYYICSGNLYQKGKKDKNIVTVSIIIDDHKEKKTYAASMGTPGVYRYGEDIAQEFNGLEKLYSTLNVIGIKDDYVVKDKFGKKRINFSEYNRLRQQILKADYLRSVDERYSSDSELDKKVSLYEKTLSKEQLDNIDYETRKLMAYDRSKIMTKAEMDELVNALIVARNQIIDQYCQIAADGTITIPKEIRKDVKPAVVEVSDGAFNNLEDDDAPLFRAVNEVKDFGLSSDTEQITNAIENGEILFGFGRGADSNTPFAISSILDPKQVFDISNRKGETGKAGVLYVLVDTGGKHLVPIQLRTERFETQEGIGLINEQHNPVVLCINPETGITSTNGDIKPSLAEVILFLACDKLSLDEIPGKDANIGRRILNLIVNCGSNTLLRPDNASQNYLKELSDKQFSVENIKLGKDLTPTKCLVIVKNEEGVRSQEAIPVDQIFSDDDLRREVVYRIAKNLHWNTEVTQEAKKTSMRDEFPADIISELRAYFEDNPSATEYKFCGLQQLSFKKSDFFVEEGGELKDKHVSVFAWMIANKHVMTDLGDRIFKDPFIFASGLSSKQSPESAVQEIKQQGGKEKGPGVSIVDKTAPIQQDRTTKEKLDKLAELKSYGANPVLRRARVQSVVAQTEEQRKEVVSKSGGEIVDKIALAVEFHKVEGETPEQTYKKQLEQSIQEYLDFANAQKIFDKKLTLADVKGLNIDRNRVQQAVAGGYVPVLIVEKNGTVSFTQQHNSSLRSGAQFTGVFSKVREGQPLTDQEAREFLSKTLGIERHNVLVLDKIFDAMTKKEVFGIMQVATDILSGDLTGQVVISRQNNLASTYHEAFHYANLLLKTRKERVDLYKQFVASRRPDLAKASLFEIEEALAEEFKLYVEQRKTSEPKTVFGKIGKFFKDLWDMINIFKKKDLVKYAFDQIIAGKYAPRTIDAQSLSDFVANYPEGAFDRFTIPGLKYEDIEKLKYITDYKTFYGVSQALMNEFIAREDFKTVGDLEKLGEDTPFVNFVEDLVLQNKDDKYRSGILEDVKNNIGIFKAVVFERLLEYGIKATSHKVKIDELKVTNTTKEDLGEDPDPESGNRDNPAHDIENFQVSKKDNVAFRAKLFLGLIEKRRFEYDELTGEKKAVSVPDRFLGLRQYEPFGEAWTKMLDDLWMCDSFDEIDEKSNNPENHYAKTSLMYKVIMFSKSQPFYTAVREKLESLYHMDEEGNMVKDILLENQILATIKSQLPITGYMRIQTPQQKKAIADTTEYISDSDMQAVAKIPGDTDKQVEIFTDQTFRAKRMLPREWSKNAVVSGLVGYTIEDGETKLTLLEAPVKALWNRYSALENQLFDVHKKGKIVTLINKTVRGQQAAKELYDSSVNQLVAILQDMGIPSDESVIENMILQNDASALNDYVKRVAGLQKLLNASTGSVRFLIDRVMMPNIGNNEIVFGRVSEKTGKSVGKKIKSPINQMYYGYKSDTFITKYAETYASVHPTPQDFSVTSPEGKRIYPISQNNWISDTVRRLNDNIDDIVTQLRRCPYQKRSVLLRDIAAKITPGIKTNDQLIRLVGFVGIKDGDKNKGADYFGMTRLEDYVSKMMMTFGRVSTIGEGDSVQKTLIDRMMILPTMADKKTYYGIIHLKLSSLFADEDVIQADGSWKFSDKTIRTFFNYFLDELDTVQQYYNKKNIAHLVNNPGLRRKNYHGKFNKKTNRLDLSGNGGMFRYCYDFIKDPTTGLNLNEMIQAKWKAQIALEELNGKSMFRDENDETDLDGFENVRSYLNEIRQSLSFKNMREMINNHLVSIVRNELESLSSEPDLKLVQKVEENGVTSYRPLKIPRDIIQYYQEKVASKYGITFKTKAYQYDSLDREACVNAVANHTINSIMSMIEYEKVFSGDQAFYKWKYQKATKLATVDGVDVDIQVLSDKNSDRVKRLGAGLSPGDNVRTKYGDEILEKYPELRYDTYTNAYINDTSYLSSYIKDIIRKFEVDRVVETIMSEKPELFEKFKNQYEELKDLSDQQIFNKLYLDQSSENKENYFDSLYKMIDAKTKSRIREEVARQASPYDHVNVSDAQVLIRPELYRKIRIGLGQWSTIEDSTGYSDEKAYLILQKDDSWMSDPEKHKIVSRLQLFPLKMTYFDNAVILESEGMPLALPRYNKMAIFPFFKYIATSKSGQLLYERMNRKNNEIDMLTFDSAVKVGANQGQPDPCETDENGKTKNLELLTKDLLADSDVHLKDGIPTTNVAKEGEYQFPVQIQHLSRLLMQLNTEAHLDEERAIGTQMFKIAFSDIIEKATYGSNQKDSKNRTGKEIRTEIMALIDALTNKGRQEIIEQYLPDKTGTESRRNIQRRLMKQIVKSNDLGQNLIDLLNGIKGTAASEPGCIESSTSRRVFEQSVQSKVNSKVVEIHTNGGSAIQQSCFGFSGVPDFSMHGKEDIEAYDKQKYHAYNGGRQIKWSKKNGSMEVLLSMNFFKSVVPLNQQGSYTQMRLWLIDHDVIEGVKSKEYWEMSEEDAQLDQLLDTEVAGLNFSVKLLKILEAANVSTLGDILEQKDKILPLLGAKIKTELEDAFDSVNISWDTKRPKIKPVRSNPKPFGIGYRIPTQGMSSMFVFTVADVLPEQSGDLIIVPPEFTAQTGSDFDIDKLFLATMKYDQGEDESTLAYSDIFDNNVGKGSIDKKKAFRQDGVSKGAIQNRLLHDYMTIIADVRNFSLSRASIDVFTSIIQDKVLPSLKEKQGDNLAGMSELTPVRQSSIKLEFKTGKEGIGPFALNITNHALTLFIGLTMDYGDNNYHLGDLYKITGEDGRHILGWLSAMVNAHVDVAKDPYIFTLNVNGITYNMTNFLIRAGKGMSTFSFIGQPILKEYCRSLSASGGLYGNNDGRVNVSGSFENKKAAQSKALILKYYKALAYKYAQEVKAGKKYTEKDSKGFTFADRMTAIKVSGDGKVEVSNAKHLDVVFDSDRMLAAAKDINQNKLNASAESLYLQILTMQAFNNLERYADQLSALVLNSRIDTKKFGKDKAEQYNFLNNYEQFRYNHVKGKSVDWYLEGMSKEQRKTVKEKHSKEALDKYFEELFLDYKLKQAVSLSRQMLHRQSFTASKTYRPLFFNTMAKLFGQEVINSPKPSIGYRQVMNPKTVLAVSNALSGLFRAKAVEGTDRYQKGLDTQFTGPIDFTFGGDKAMADGFVHLLLYGATTDGDRSKYADILLTFPHMSKPLFQRVSSFLSYISHPMDVLNSLEAATKYLEISDGLVNPETGEIENDFLNYLKPIPPSEHFPQGQLLLQESAFNRSSDRTSPLISAFSDLLNHKSEIVRRLARELAIYAYYTSYGQNSRDAFFDLVPLEFRVQYDLAIKDDLYNEDKIAQHMGSTQTGIDYEQVVDAIVRNYWYDQDVVPTKLESTTIGKTRDAFLVGSDDIGLCRMRLRILDKKSANVYGIIVTNDSYGDYFTVNHGKDSFLYKKVGEIDKYQFIAKPTETSDYSTTSTKTSVYFIIPKLGRHSGSNHSYELASGSDRASVYEENRLPVQFERGNLMLTLKQWMENPNASQAKKTNHPSMYVAIDEKYNAQFKTDVLPIKRNVTIKGEKYPLLQVTTAFIPTSTSEIAGDFSEDINQVLGNNYYNNTGDVRALIQKGDLKQAVINNRDVTFVLNFGDEIESGKVINIPRNATQKQIESAVNKWLKEHNITTEKSITIGQIGDNLDVSVSKKEVEDFVKRQVALRQSMTDNQAEIDEIETAARELAEELIKLDKRTRIFGKTILNLIHAGYTINTMYSTGNVGTEQAFVNAGRLLSDWLDFGQVYIYVPKSYMNVENIRKYEEKMGMYDGEPVLISTKEEAQEVQSTIAAQELLEEAVTSEPKNKNIFTSARTADNNYEVSSKGDKRFSAYYAKFKPDTIIDGIDVGNMTIENVYQSVIKKSSKGKGPSKNSIVNLDRTEDDGTPSWIADQKIQEMLPIPLWHKLFGVYAGNYAATGLEDTEITKEDKEDFSYYVGYLPLWQKWAEQNPELIEELRSVASGKILTDRFASTRVSQARALADILNESSTQTVKQKPSILEMSEQKEETPEAVNDIETEIVDMGTIELDDLLNAIGEENVFTSDDSETDKDAMENCKNGGTE